MAWIETVTRAAKLTSLTLACALPALLCIEDSWGGRLYLLSLGLLLLQSFFSCSKRWLFSSALTSLILLTIWFASETKLAYVGTRLFLQDIYHLDTAVTISWLYAGKFLPIFLWLIFSISLTAYHEVRTQSQIKYELLSLCILLLTFISVNHYYHPDIAIGRSSKNAWPIFIQSSYRLNLHDIDIKQPSFCCLHANRAAETFIKQPDTLPNIIFILEESTFDPNLIKGYSPQTKYFPEHTPLHVHTVGGLSWVQEVALLHGVPPTLYGDSWPVANIVTQPYYAARLPHMLTTTGYQTTTVTSVPKKFYGIEQSHQALGMSRVIGCNQQDGCRNQPWPEIHDSVFFNTAQQVLANQSNRPNFLFIETIRQHSPHNLTAHPFDKNRCHKEDLSDIQCRVMQEYDYRYQSSSEDLQQFFQSLKSHSRRTIVVAFGDHIPSDVNIVFSEKDFKTRDKKQTIFTIWDSENGLVTKKIMQQYQLSHQPVDVAFLDAIVLQYAGFSSEYIREKLQYMQQKNGIFTEN